MLPLRQSRRAVAAGSSASAAKGVAMQVQDRSAIPMAATVEGRPSASTIEAIAHTQHVGSARVAGARVA